jgi:DNA polymerase delta subunit 1
MKIQLLSFYECDDDTEYTVYAFGRTTSYSSVCLKIKNILPFFYISINKHCSYIDEFTTSLKKNKNIFSIISLENKQSLYENYKNYKQYENNNKNTKNTKNTNPKTFVSSSSSSSSLLFFYKLSFCSIENYKKTVSYFYNIYNDDTNITFYETNVPLLLKFYHITDIQPSGWIELDENDEQCDMLYSSSLCATTYEVPYTIIQPIQDSTEQQLETCFKIASLDIECFSYHSYVHKDASVFPDYKHPLDIICQIGIVFSDTTQLCFIVSDKYTQSQFDNYVLACSIDGDYLNVQFIQCTNEKELLYKVVSCLRDTDIDILTGYNVFGFDFNYMYERMVFHQINEDILNYFSKIIDVSGTFETKTMSSVAFGMNEWKYFHFPGVFTFDLYTYIKREYKLPSYKLDNVATHFLNQQKNDITPKLLFQKVQGSLKDVCEVAFYCLQDCQLVLNLITHLQVVVRLIEMSKLTMVPIDYLIFRGQQIKVFSQIVYEASKENYLVPYIQNNNNKNNTNDEETSDEEENEENNKNDKNSTKKESYEGATVLTATTGAHFKPVTGLDFASLYPSIMIAYNICYSTLCLNPTENKENEKNEEYEHFQLSETCHVQYTQTRKGLLPKILEKLWQERKNIKRLLKQNDYPEHVKNILDAKQLSIKLSMNSLYGFTGSKFGILPCFYLAASVTSKGRELIQFSKSKIEELYPNNARVLYGDTDSIYTVFESAGTDLNEVFRISKEAECVINTYYKKPIEIEFEKVMYPFILFTKKRYVSLIYTNPLTPDKIDYKGVQLVRRDTCEYVKESMVSIYESLMYTKNIEQCIHLAKTCIDDLLSGRIPIHKLVMSKLLNAHYKTDTLPHVLVSKLAKKRDPNNCYVVGDRVPFLFIDNGESLQSKRVEDYAYIKDHIDSIKIDYLTYYNSQLKKQINELFQLITSNKEFTFDTYFTPLLSIRKKQQELTKKQLQNKKNGQHEITSFFKKK